MGHEALVDSLLTLELTANPKLPSGKFDGIAVTSANAVRAANNLEKLSTLLSIPAFAVGARTAEALKAAGFEQVTYSQGDVSDLARLLTERVKPGSRLLHLAGEHRAQAFSALLAPKIEVATCVLYRMRAAASLSSETIEAIAQGNIDAVLHYSPRSAAMFVTLMERAGLTGKLSGLRHLCLSEAVAAPILAGGGKAKIAAQPDENTLLSII